MNSQKINQMEITRAEALATGRITDLATDAKSRALLDELSFKMPVAISLLADAEVTDRRELLLALKEALPISSRKIGAYFYVPTGTEKKWVCLKVLREFENRKPLFTIMTCDEWIGFA